MRSLSMSACAAPCRRMPSSSYPLSPRHDSSIALLRCLGQVFAVNNIGADKSRDYDLSYLLTDINPFVCDTRRSQPNCARADAIQRWLGGE